MKVLNKILSSVLAFMVAAMVVVCCWQVITRFVLGNPSKYTEEILRFALIWLTMLGAPYAYGAKQHLAIDLLVKSFEPTGQRRTQIFVEFVVLALSAAVFVVGGIAVTMNAHGEAAHGVLLRLHSHRRCADDPLQPEQSVSSLPG